MKWRTSPPGAAGLFIVLGFNVWLLMAIATEIISDRSAAADKVNWSPGLPSTVGNISSRKPIEGYGQILVRPVFFKTREPYVAPPPPPSPAFIAMPPAHGRRSRSYFRGHHDQERCQEGLCVQQGWCERRLDKGR